MTTKKKRLYKIETERRIKKGEVSILLYIPLFLLLKMRHAKKIYTKPLLKWVGGKTQLLDILLPLFPVEIQNYYELFIGGGSVLLALLSETPRRIQGNIYAYDTNPVLISFYQHLQTQPQALYEILQEIIQEFQSISPTSPLTKDKPIRKPNTLEEAKTSRESYYYWIRQRYNSMTTEQQQRAYGVALFFFLNKTCFRGIYRVGPNGFNVPYGHYTNPEIVDYEHWMEIHRLLEPVILLVMDCSISMTLPQTGDFVYLDPPYVQETKTSFVGYSLEGFSLEKSRLLFYQCHRWIERGISWVMSNSDTPLLGESFPEETPEKKYHIQQVSCRRAVNAKHPESIAKEIVVSHISTATESMSKIHEEVATEVEEESR